VVVLNQILKGEEHLALLEVSSFILMNRDPMISVFSSNIYSLSLLKSPWRNQPAVLIIHKYDLVVPLKLHSFAMTWSAPRTISLSVSFGRLSLSLTVLMVMILVLFVLKSKLKNKVQSQRLPEDFVNASIAATTSGELNQS